MIFTAEPFSCVHFQPAFIVARNAMRAHLRKKMCSPEEDEDFIVVASEREFSENQALPYLCGEVHEKIWF